LNFCQSLIRSFFGLVSLGQSFDVDLELYDIHGNRTDNKGLSPSEFVKHIQLMISCKGVGQTFVVAKNFSFLEANTLRITFTPNTLGKMNIFCEANERVGQFGMTGLWCGEKKWVDVTVSDASNSKRLCEAMLFANASNGTPDICTQCNLKKSRNCGNCGSMLNTIDVKPMQLCHFCTVSKKKECYFCGKPTFPTSAGMIKLCKTCNAQKCYGRKAL
jgi:hypothetical protein